MRQPNVSLAAYTYMKVGGPADWLIEVNSSESLEEAITTARHDSLPFIVIGGGSNIIFTDLGFRGLVIVNRANKVQIDPANLSLITESGAPTNLVVNQANRAGLAGLEEFMGIPGTIGGAIYNNSHFGPKLIGDYVNTALILDNSGVKRQITKEDLHFGYDDSVLQHTHDVVLSIEFKLASGDPQKLAQISQESVIKRQTTQPLEFPSSGCMFKNLSIPTADGITSAGALIDKTGLKGLRQGDAEISDKHANFIINHGNATAKDVIDLSNQVIEAVNQKWGIKLHPEVFILNEHGERINHECL